MRTGRRPARHTFLCVARQNSFSSKLFYQNIFHRDTTITSFHDGAGAAGHYHCPNFNVSRRTTRIGLQRTALAQTTQQRTVFLIHRDARLAFPPNSNRLKGKMIQHEKVPGLAIELLSDVQPGSSRINHGEQRRHDHCHPQLVDSADSADSADSINVTIDQAAHR